MRMRAEMEAARDKADDLSKTLIETNEKLHQVEEDRNNLQRLDFSHIQILCRAVIFKFSATTCLLSFMELLAT